MGTDPFYQYLLGPPTFFQIDEVILADAIRSGTLLACSDGTFDPTTGLGSHPICNFSICEATGGGTYVWESRNILCVSIQTQRASVAAVSDT